MENENLASDIIKGLLKVIIVLIITNVLTISGFLIYLSLPVDYAETEKCYQEAHDSGNNSYIGGDNNVGYTDNNENKKD